jgi:deoxyribose-phosphate aldolase
VSDGEDAAALRAWTSAVARWTPGLDFPSVLAPQSYGLQRPGGPARQLPWGIAAAERLHSPAALAGYLDHTLLQPEATAEEVRQLAHEARTHGLAGACVHPVHVSALVEALGTAQVVAISVVGFPHGAHRPHVKALEARQAVADGARELDAVAALGWLRAADVEAALEDVLAVVEAARPWPVKLILETGCLDKRAVVLGAGLALVAGCAAVKTSTGFTGLGARVEDVALLRAVVGEALGVKASAGIRTRAAALALVKAGASRLGTSASLSLIGV